MSVTALSFSNLLQNEINIPGWFPWFHSQIQMINTENVNTYVSFSLFLEKKIHEQQLRKAGEGGIKEERMQKLGGR